MAAPVLEVLKEALTDVNNLKTTERTEEQRRIAILATKIEDALAWAKHTFLK